MIASLRGTVHRLKLNEAIVDVRGTGYMVSVPTNVWEELQEGTECTLWIYTYVREDRLDLYGFLRWEDRTLFELLIAQSGIGPRMGLELCAVPKALLLQAVEQKDGNLLSTVKGIGKKKAEKLIIELATIAEKSPHIFGTSTQNKGKETSFYDQDAIDALASLGYNTPTILQTLKNLPVDLATTEERVAAALRSL